MSPVRVQLSRAKGWRMPPDTVKVDRSTRWGNPHNWADWLAAWRSELPGHGATSGEVGRDDWCRDRAVQAFREDIAEGVIAWPFQELRGKNLACWCKLGSPCHADALLKLANDPPPISLGLAKIEDDGALEAVNPSSPNPQEPA